MREMYAKALDFARAWSATALLVWFLVAGITSAWLLGLKWISIAVSLASLCLLVLLAHAWGQVEEALARGAEDSSPTT